MGADGGGEAWLSGNICQSAGDGDAQGASGDIVVIDRAVNGLSVTTGLMVTSNNDTRSTTGADILGADGTWPREIEGGSEADNASSMIPSLIATSDDVSQPAIA